MEHMRARHAYSRRRARKDQAAKNSLLVFLNILAKSRELFAAEFCIWMLYSQKDMYRANQPSVSNVMEDNSILARYGNVTLVTCLGCVCELPLPYPCFQNNPLLFHLTVTYSELRG